jgi:hypothetical protein
METASSGKTYTWALVIKLLLKAQPTNQLQDSPSTTYLAFSSGSKRMNWWRANQARGLQSRSWKGRRVRGQRGNVTSIGWKLHDV